MHVCTGSRSIAEGKLNFINWLDIQMPEDLYWLLLGDINHIRKPEDRSSSGGNLTEIFLFNESICKMESLSMGGNSHHVDGPCRAAVLNSRPRHGPTGT